MTKFGQAEYSDFMAKVFAELLGVQLGKKG